MGLFWSMGPDPEPKPANHSFFSTTGFIAPIITELEAWQGNGCIAGEK